MIAVILCILKSSVSTSRSELDVARMNFGGAVEGGHLDEREDEIYGGSRSAASTPQSGT